MIWFVAGSIALILFLLLGKWFAQADPKALASTGRRLGGVALMAFSAFIGLRGNLALAGPLAIVGWMMFLGRPLGIFGWMGWRSEPFERAKLYGRNRDDPYDAGP